MEAVFFAAWMWFFERGARRRAAAFTAGLSPESRDVVWDAVRTGVRPADPMLGEIALAICRYRLQRHMDNRLISCAVYVLLLGVSVAFAATASGIPWKAYIGIVTFAGGTVWTMRYRGVLQRRIASLQRRPATV